MLSYVLTYSCQKIKHRGSIHFVLPPILFNDQFIIYILVYNLSARMNHHQISISYLHNHPYWNLEYSVPIICQFFSQHSTMVRGCVLYTRQVSDVREGAINRLNTDIIQWNTNTIITSLRRIAGYALYSRFLIAVDLLRHNSW